MPVATRLWQGTRYIGSGFLAGFGFEVHQCGTCGVTWALEAAYIEARKEDGEGWKCPQGHSFVFNDGESRADILERRLARERDRSALLAAERDQAEASLRTTKGHLTRKRKELARTTAGVCPVDGCRRHFTNLERHMASKHPGVSL